MADNPLEWLVSLWRKQAVKYQYKVIPTVNIQHDDSRQIENKPLRAGENYFQLWLAEMSLKYERDNFSAWNPLVCSSVNFRFGNKDELITRIVGESLLKNVVEKNQNRIVSLNNALTPLLPFNGGSIQLGAGLLAMAGGNSVKTFLEVLGTSSNLLMVPQLSAALTIAPIVAGGLAKFTSATENELVLGLNQTWTASEGNLSLPSGYFVVIAAGASEIDTGKLRVKDGRLRYGESLENSRPVTGYDFMLFRIDRSKERDDWNALENIQNPYTQAILALKAKNVTQAESYILSAKTAALLSNDLTWKVDRKRVIEQIQSGYDNAKSMMVSLGAVPKKIDTSLSSLMKNAERPNEASFRTFNPERFGLKGVVYPEVMRNEPTPEPPRDPEKKTKGKIRVPVNFERRNATRGALRSVTGRSLGFSLSGDPISPTVEEKTPAINKGKVPEIDSGPKQFYFALEGAATKGNVVEYESYVDLIFDYGVPLIEMAVATVKGKKLERARRMELALGVTVMPVGFAYRTGEEYLWHQIAHFKAGGIQERLVFKFRAFAKEKATPEKGTHVITGFRISFDVKGSLLYQFFLPVKLVDSIARQRESKTAYEPLEFDLDELKDFAKTAATENKNMRSALEEALKKTK